MEQSNEFTEVPDACIAEPPAGSMGQKEGKGAASTHFNQHVENTETWENPRPLWAMVLRPAGFSRTVLPVSAMKSFNFL